MDPRLQLPPLPPFPRCLVCRSSRVYIDSAEYRTNREGTAVVGRRRFRCWECPGVTRDQYESSPMSKAEFKRMWGA